VLLVVVILLCVYRSPLMALIPLVSIAAAGVGWRSTSWPSARSFPAFVLVNISQVFAIVMLYGAGTDYCLFLISRYREGTDPRQDAEAGAQGRRGAAVGRSAGGQRRHRDLRPWG